MRHDSSRLKLAERLKAEELTDDELRVVEALGWRAMQAKCREVESAVATVICALQGNYGLTADEVDAKLCVSATLRETKKETA